MKFVINYTLINYRYTNDFIYTEPSRINKYIYQYKRETEESYGRYYASDGCKNQVILDLEKLAKGHDYFDVQSVEISSDEKYIAFSVDKLGDRVCNIYYKEIFNDKLHLVSMNHKSQQGNKETKYIKGKGSAGFISAVESWLVNK